MKVAFYSNQLCLRGTTVALYDYAAGNEDELGNTSVIAYRADSPDNDPDVIARFNRRFAGRVYGIRNFAALDELCCDVVYCIKGGHDEGDPPIKTRLCVHCVFLISDALMKQSSTALRRSPTASVVAAIAPWVKNAGRSPVVPHMIRDLGQPSHDFRRQHGIPINATVFGRYGGYKEFNISWVKRIICDLKEPNIYFVFVNTEPFTTANNILFLPKIVEPADKAAFIDACDAMIWARAEGEVFSLAMGEFSSRNKPILCCVEPDMDNVGHIRLLKHRAVLYTKESLAGILSSFDREAAKLGDWNAYRAYTPSAVMAQFRDVFLPP